MPRARLNARSQNISPIRSHSRRPYGAAFRCEIRAGAAKLLRQKEE